MTAISIRQFGGIAPKTPARYLQDTQAQTAKNCAPWFGSLQPLPDTVKLADLALGTGVESLYRFGQDINDETLYWFQWAKDVDVVRGFINGDTTERTFYSGDGGPKATDNTLALSGSNGLYPHASYMLGVPQPTASLLATVQGTAETGASTETRVYTYTIVNEWGEESAPYTAVGVNTTVDVETGQTVQITFPSTPSGNYKPQYRRLYRSVNGVYLLVYVEVNGTRTADIPVATLNVVDTATADELGSEVMPSLTWLPPPDDLLGLTGMTNGVMAGFTGIDVYFCEPYRPFAWPIQYQQSVSAKIVGLAAIDTTLVVLTEGKPVFMQGSHPDSVVVVESDISQACVSKDSIVSMNGMVLYASPDGLVALAPGGSQIITESLFLKEQWQQYKPESIKAFAYEDRYIAFYDNGTEQGGFVYDPRSSSFITHDMYATAGYTDLKNDTLYLAVGSELHKWEQGALLDYTWKSKKFTLPDPTAFSCFRVKAEAYPVELTVYKDGVTYHTATVTDDGIHRLPSGYGHAFEIALTGQGEVYLVQLGQSPRELASA